MIRTVVENLLLFLLPTLIYVAWVLMTREQTTSDGAGPGSGPSGILDDAPLLWLFALGAILVVVTLIAFGTSSGGKPGQHYEPPSMKDGRIEPGHLE
jgi:hypothetical protein